MIDRLLAFAVARRWHIVVLAVVAAGYGASMLTQLPVDAVPDITNRQVQINIADPALGPVEMEKQVAFPIETALSGIPGLETTRSLSRNGYAQVTAVFEDRVDIYFARQQVAERLAQARDALPASVEPVIGPITTGLGEIVMFTVEFEHPGGRGAPRMAGRQGWQAGGFYLTPEGEKLADEAARVTYLRTVLDWIVRPQLRQVTGLAGVDAIGGYVKQYAVTPDPARLAALGLSMTDLVEALQNANLGFGAGTVDRGGEGLAVRADARIAEGSAIGETVIASRGGAPLRVADVATVSLGREVRTGSATENGREVVIGTALMLAGANSRTVAQATVAKLDEIGRALPPGVKIRVTLDRSKLVDATIDTVTKSLAEGALLVVVVLFLLLGNIRAAVITALVIPFSMLLATIGMVETGTSANLMSLGALDFGLIVDGAVIIVENCLRRLAERQHGRDGALPLAERLKVVRDATREMVRPALFGQGIIILVYLPLFAFQGVEGKMFAPMATTVVLALVAAFVLSLTLVPAMVAILMTRPVAEKESAVMAGASRLYAPALDRALAMPWLFIGGAAAAFGVALALFTTLGREFIPTLDEGDIAVQAVRIPSISLDQSTAMQAQVERALMAAPEVALVFAKTGTAEVTSDPMPSNVTDGFVILKPRSAWPDPGLPKSELVEGLEARLARVPGNNFEFSQPIQLRFNELIAGVRSDVAVRVYGDDFASMLPVAERVAASLRATPGSADVRVEQVEGVPALSVEFDRAAIAAAGLTVREVADAVQVALGGRAAGQIFEGDRRFDIVVRMPDTLRRDLDALGALPVKLHTSEGDDRVMLLRQLVRFVVRNAPNQVSRDKGKRRIVVQANVRGRDLGGFVADARDRVTRDVQVPAGSWLEWGGAFENLQRAQARLTLVVPAVFAAIFGLLFLALGSWRRAAMVFSAVPLALTGGVVLLWLRDMPFSISAAVGFIALSGVAVLNGLVMMSSILRLIEDGRPVSDAIREGALARLRPVVTTALVASLGFVPMALATGTGAEVQQPIATVVIGGLISATTLTLLVLPALARLVLEAERRVECNHPATAIPTSGSLGAQAIEASH
ncbi:efflux RND transporter permease subunit [Glacieibacterium frigidum]|uniref:CusA/CzcA family heavy metal efflux RND transporter n=1 Tax=Glacieibacterium frigidum TaxID=2593303 RepID=A0A552U9Q7_9SPHN|nr:CusA/CzcA family heavy metal efflux RND transporter [Glacieibacterium frigidum]TRW14953.1 CusA/CzcA family heavy metal efflux RND transporter [Glacieibacterium frigidum]